MAPKKDEILAASCVHIFITNIMRKLALFWYTSYGRTVRTPRQEGDVYKGRTDEEPPKPQPVTIRYAIKVMRQETKEPSIHQFVRLPM